MQVLKLIAKIQKKGKMYSEHSVFEQLRIFHPILTLATPGKMIFSPEDCTQLSNNMVI